MGSPTGCGPAVRPFSRTPGRCGRRPGCGVPAGRAWRSYHRTRARAVPGPGGYGVIMRTGTPNRVLMTTDTVGGVWTYAIDLVRALGQRGVEVALASMGAPTSDEQRRQAQQIPTLELF